MSCTHILDTVEPFTGSNCRLFVDFTKENPVRDSCVICGYSWTMKSSSYCSDKSAGMCVLLGNLSWASGCSVRGMPAITVTVNTIWRLRCVSLHVRLFHSDCIEISDEVRQPGRLLHGDCMDSGVVCKFLGQDLSMCHVHSKRWVVLAPCIDVNISVICHNHYIRRLEASTIFTDRQQDFHCSFRNTVAEPECCWKSFTVLIHFLISNVIFSPVCSVLWPCQSACRTLPPHSGGLLTILLKSIGSIIII